MVNCLKSKMNIQDPRCSCELCKDWRDTQDKPKAKEDEDGEE